MEARKFPEEEAVSRRVRQELSDLRYQHTQGVVETAAELAQAHGLDVAKARLAAWIHDIAREWPLERLQQMAERVEIPSGFAAIPVLLHGPIAAQLAREWFGIEDEDIQNAIRYHTTGRVGMSPLEQVIFLADAIEPGREYPGVDRLRSLARTNLMQAVAESIDSTLTYLIQTHRPIFPLTVMARNEFWEKLHKLSS